VRASGATPTASRLGSVLAHSNIDGVSALSAGGVMFMLPDVTTATGALFSDMNEDDFDKVFAQKFLQVCACVRVYLFFKRGMAEDWRVCASWEGGVGQEGSPTNERSMTRRESGARAGRRLQAAKTGMYDEKPREEQAVDYSFEHQRGGMTALEGMRDELLPSEQAQSTGQALARRVLERVRGGKGNEGGRRFAFVLPRRIAVACGEQGGGYIGGQLISFVPSGVDTRRGVGDVWKLLLTKVLTGARGLAAVQFRLAQEKGIDFAPAVGNLGIRRFRNAVRRVIQQGKRRSPQAMRMHPRPMSHGPQRGYVLVEKQLNEDGTEGTATVWKYFVQDEEHATDQLMFVARKVCV